MINRQKHNTQCLHDTVELKDKDTCIQGDNERGRNGMAAIFVLLNVLI